jgi:formate dehydrogenase maturation protein FdhE
MSLKLKIKKWVANKAEQCKNVAPLYSYALDRKLTLLERFRIRFHLLTCNACTSYLKNLNFMHDVFHTQAEQIESENLHVSLSQDAKERIKANLKSRQK